LRYLITGGAGFIGSHLSERLIDRGDHVVVLDNLSTGSMENIRHLKSSARMEYHLDGIENRQLVAELVDDADVVVHLAAAVGVKLIVESPVRTIETNVNGTQMILEAACRKRKLVLTASTSEVYGKSTNIPFHEDADLVLGPTTKGRWSYAASKALDEFLALSYWKEKKLPVIVVRLFNTVGPRQTGRYGMVLPNFVKSALSNSPISIFGNGQQSRCFCDVRDTVEALLRLPERNRFMKGLYAWVGYRSIAVTFETADRSTGKSSFRLTDLAELALTGLTAFSSLPLRLVSVAGWVSSRSASSVGVVW